MLVMVNEKTGDKYARAVGRKGVGEELHWVVKDMSEEMKVWGHTGGVGGKIIMKSDGEPSAVARAVGETSNPVVAPRLLASACAWFRGCLRAGTLNMYTLRVARCACVSAGRCA